METDSFRSLLGRVRERLGDRLLLSRLGLALREIEPGFRVESYSATSLTDLLRQVPDVGALVWDAQQKWFVFSGSHERPTGPLRLQADLWRAVTDFRAEGGGWYMDLDTLQLRHPSRDPGKLLETESERFVAVPVLGVAFQKELAREFTKEHLPDQMAAVESALSTEDWLSAFLDLVESAGLGERWRAMRSARISGVVVKWAEQHGIAREHITEVSRRPTPMIHRAPLPGTSTGDDLQDMRALLHAAVDMMSLPELAALNVPPAYLALVASRRRL